MTDSFDGLISELTDDADEAKLMRGALSLLAYAAEEARPPEGLRARLLDRISQAAGPARFEAENSYFARANLIDWVPLAPGVEVKLLYRDRETGAQTLLIRMEPDRPFPPHGHEHIEDLYLVAGDAFVGDIPMYAGDYCRAPAGSEHNTVRSGASGSLAVVVSR